MTFLTLRGVEKRFGSFMAVEDFGLEVERGEFVSFLGPSGCGKTTTLRMIAGFERPTAGRIHVGDVDVTDRPPNRRNVGMVFQSYALFPNMTVAQNIGFGLRVRHRPATEIAQRVDELLALIHLPDVGSRYPYQLSGGQQQRVALARALAIEPQVLLLDEPLSALDAKIRVALRAEIRSIQRTLGITTVYVTHDQEEALSLSDRIVVMGHGRIEQVGTPFEVYNRPATPFVAAFVGTLNSVIAIVEDAPTGVLRLGEARVKTGRAVAAPAGASVRIGIRPEMITLGPAREGANQLWTVVEDVDFLGAVVRVRVRLADQATTLAVDTFNAPHLAVPRPGDTIPVAFPPEACLMGATE